MFQQLDGERSLRNVAVASKMWEEVQRTAREWRRTGNHLPTRDYFVPRSSRALKAPKPDEF